jgi:hypothetical protein
MSNTHIFLNVAREIQAQYQTSNLLDQFWANLYLIELNCKMTSVKHSQPSEMDKKQLDMMAKEMVTCCLTILITFSVFIFKYFCAVWCCCFVCSVFFTEVIHYNFW